MLPQVIQFLRSLGINVDARRIEHPTLVPGLDILAGGLIYDEPHLSSPADLLHEGAHIALTPPALRAALTGTIESSPAEEVSAIAWTWAAALHLGLDTRRVFHEDVVSGNGPTLLENFSAGRYVGVPMLQLWGLTRADEYPRMRRWLRD
ncbi:MAG TPA: hypothetical protein VGR02_17980 [Thermoanaerobaculia bacterium]|jgi:hypothetical protein|nr:hypothetical protein [Thermoanaerobaculia bacterium]